MKEAYMQTSFESAPDLTLVRPNGYSKSGDIFMAEAAAEQHVPQQEIKQPTPIRPDVPVASVNIPNQETPSDPEIAFLRTQIATVETRLNTAKSSAEREAALKEYVRLGEQWDQKLGRYIEVDRYDQLVAKRDNLLLQKFQAKNVDEIRTIDQAVAQLDQEIARAESEVTHILYGDEIYDDQGDENTTDLAQVNPNLIGQIKAGLIKPDSTLVVHATAGGVGGGPTPIGRGRQNNQGRGGNRGRRGGSGGGGRAGGPDGGGVERDPYKEPQSFEEMVVDISRYFVDQGRQVYSPIDGKFPMFKVYDRDADPATAQPISLTSWDDFFSRFRPKEAITGPNPGNPAETVTLGYREVPSTVRLEVDVPAFTRWAINAANLLKTSSPRSQHDFFSNAGLLRIPGRARGLTFNVILNDAYAETLFRSEHVTLDNDGNEQKKDFSSARFEVMKAMIAYGLENNNLAMMDADMGSAEGAQRIAQQILYGLNNPVFNTSILQNATEISQNFDVETTIDNNNKESYKPKQDHRVGAAVALTVETYQMISSNVTETGMDGNIKLKEHFRAGGVDLLTREMFEDIRDRRAKLRVVDKQLFISDADLDKFFIKEGPDKGQLNKSKVQDFVDFMNPYNSNAKPPLQVELIREVVKRVVANKVGLYYRDKEGNFIQPDFGGKTKTFELEGSANGQEIYKGTWTDEHGVLKTKWYKRDKTGLFAELKEDENTNTYKDEFVVDGDGKHTEGGPTIDAEFGTYVDFVGQAHVRPLLVSQKFDRNLQGFNFFTRLTLRAAMTAKNFGKNEGGTRLSFGGMRANLALFPALITSAYESIPTRTIDNDLTVADAKGKTHFKSIAKVYRDIAAPFLQERAMSETQKTKDKRVQDDAEKSAKWGKHSSELTFNENEFRNYNDNVIKPAVKLLGLLQDETKLDPKKMLIWDAQIKDYRVDEHHLWHAFGEVAGAWRNIYSTNPFDGMQRTLMPIEQTIQQGEDHRAGLDNLLKDHFVKNYKEMSSWEAQFHPMVMDLEEFTRPLKVVDVLNIVQEDPTKRTTAYVFRKMIKKEEEVLDQHGHHTKITTYEVDKNDNNEYAKILGKDGKINYHKITSGKKEQDVTVEENGTPFGGDPKLWEVVEMKHNTTDQAFWRRKQNQSRQIDPSLIDANKVIEEATLGAVAAWVATLSAHDSLERILQPHHVEQLKIALLRVMNGTQIHDVNNPLQAHAARNVFTRKQIDRWFNAAREGTLLHTIKGGFFDFFHAMSLGGVIGGVWKQVQAA